MKEKIEKILEANILQSSGWIEGFDVEKATKELMQLFEKPICKKCGELLHSGKCEDVTSSSIEYED